MISPDDITVSLVYVLEIGKQVPYRNNLTILHRFQPSKTTEFEFCFFFHLFALDRDLPHCAATANGNPPWMK